jgi:glycerol transport system ATP-binding protein
MKMARVDIQNLSYSYDKQTYALKDVSISMEKEGRYSLLGPSGCGKTTLLKIIAGVLVDYEGEVYFNGQNIRDVPIERRDIAMIFQSPVVYPMTVYDNLIFPIRRERMTARQRDTKVREIAELLELSGVLTVPAHKLGPADRQTVALGRSLIKNAHIILLDEPLTSIESEKRVELRTKIRRIQEEQKKIFVYVTHDQSEALTLSDRIAVMKDGKVLQFDTKEHIYDRPAHTFVGYFMGSPGMNVLDGEKKNGRMSFQDFELPIPQEYSQYIEQNPKFKLGLRPEVLRISKDERAGHLPFHCQDVEEKGEGVRVLYLKSMEGRNELRAVGKFLDIQPGDDLWVEIPPDKIRIYDRETGQIVA